MSEQAVSANKAVFFTHTIVDEQGVLHEQNDIPDGYVHGAHGELHEQIEKALDGHAVGDVVEVTLKPEESFGYPDPDLIAQDDIANVPPEYLIIGAEATVENAKGETISMRVTAIENGKVTVDGNHPLAGKIITFTITIVDIRDATPDEIANGIPRGQDQTH